MVAPPLIASEDRTVPGYRLLAIPAHAVSTRRTAGAMKLRRPTPVTRTVLRFSGRHLLVLLVAAGSPIFSCYAQYISLSHESLPPQLFLQAIINLSQAGVIRDPRRVERVLEISLSENQHTEYSDGLPIRITELTPRSPPPWGLGTEFSYAVYSPYLRDPLRPGITAELKFNSISRSMCLTSRNLYDSLASSSRFLPNFPFFYAYGYITAQRSESQTSVLVDAPAYDSSDCIIALSVQERAPAHFLVPMR